MVYLYVNLKHVGERASHVICSGRKCNVEWALDASGRMPAQEYYSELTENEQAKFLAVAKRLAEGETLNLEKFRKLKGLSLFEIKFGPHRFLGDFRRGGRFLIAHGARKPGPKLHASDFKIAERIMAENDLIQLGGRS